MNAKRRQLGEIVMKRFVFSALAAATAIAVATPAAAQGNCTRDQLDEMASSWVAALESGSVFEMQLGNWVDYRENFKLGTLSGLFTKPRTVDWHLKLLDTAQCRVFIETVITDEEQPLVMATQISSGWQGGVGTINNITTSTDDWLFNARNTYLYASREDWGPIPEDQRASRTELIAAANAYLDLFNDKSVEVPWGTPCNRLEGGIYTGKGEPDDSCDVGVPENVKLTNREYITDETIGAVAVFLEFGEAKRPDSHLFRVENGKIRYIHTVTNCGGEVNCGFPPVDWSQHPQPPGV